MEDLSRHCVFCEKSLVSRFSLSRHYLNIHKIPICFDFVSKSKDDCLFVKKEGVSTEVIEPPPNTHKQWHCEKCKGVFKRKWTLERHKNICDGTMRIKDAHSCQYCNKPFKHTTTKYRHYLICPKKAEMERIVKVISYKPKDMEFNTTTLNVDEIIKKMKYASRDELTHELLLDYAKELFKCPDNRCLRKSSLHLGYTLAFDGTEWEKIIDRLLYPRFACELANHFSGFIYQYKEKFSKKQFDRIVSYIDYMADKGYVNSNNKEYQQQIAKDFQCYVKSLRIYIHDITVNG